MARQRIKIFLALKYYAVIDPVPAALFNSIIMKF